MAHILLLASVVALAAACGDVASAQGPSPATATDCDAVVHARLLPCLTYVQAGSNLTRPEKGCCRGLSSAAQDDLDEPVNLLLPTVCNTMAPPPSLCPCKFLFSASLIYSELLLPAIRLFLPLPDL
ncbi:unnamed protein product [Spirodela intermedia]|uniref:Bifunctional inhibitor/plant lipid transfer protein/seed storage helical domain-containing protein n=2 Tax=Spirodela intermedia TaxID=51605 RepID=A0A7I8IGB2_SPIIN|nr:unnamed protein product [Spirodela intermedia]CAA6655902.1 unnamed protein product [Spirodela intermedia]CAA7391300.1 unnamed protein product [Spirodela intermedia]